MGKISSAFLIFTVFVVAELLICCSGEEADATLRCVLRERNALLRFKASFSDPFDRLISWNTSTDCCGWQGIKCDQRGHVIGLDLQNKRYYADHSPSFANMLQSKMLDSSILDLKHLSLLDLSANDFNLAPIPSFLGSISKMQHLNLSTSNFSGVVPHHLGNLSFLNVLDLSYNNIHQLIVDDFAWESHLSLLRHLNLSSVDLSRTSNLLKVLNMLPYIGDIRFSSSRLENKNLQHACVNSALGHIEYLYLSNNSFHGDLPCFLENMTSLRYLHLSRNNYDSCNMLHLAKLTNLVWLNLDYNSLMCNVDSIISEFTLNKPHLEFLSFRNNSCQGDLSIMFRNLSGRGDQKLKFLGLGMNNFYGQLPEEIGGMRKLEILYLDGNHISGPIPTSLGQLSNLEVLYLYQNNLDGMIVESHFATLSKLRIFRINSNNLKFGVRSNWIPPFKLQLLDVGSCEFVGGEIPKWIQRQTYLEYLAMPNSSISGPLPNWLSHMSLKYLDLSHNSIDGTIPDSLCQMKYLEHLYLSNNSLSGNLPAECWVMLNRLQSLSLSSNRLFGVIPNSICGASSLSWLQLNGNGFSGELPYGLRNCTNMEVLDIGENSISGELPQWIGKYLLNLRVLRLSNNKLFSKVPSNLCQLSRLQILDLANNMLTGNIPHCIGNLSTMALYNSNMTLFSVEISQGISLQLIIKGVALDYFYTLRYVVYMDLSNNSLVGGIPVELSKLVALRFLNLSHNHLRSNIPPQIGKMNLLESLDLSNNNLSGNIPSSLSGLNFLNHLNLSHNNLTGQIPTGPQLQTLVDTSIYEGNPGLCGAPSPKKCHDDESSNAPNEGNHDVEDEEDAVDRIWLYGLVTTGFATGFWGAIGVLVFKRGWRYVFFKFSDGIIARMMGVSG